MVAVSDLFVLIQWKEEKEKSEQSRCKDSCVKRKEVTGEVEKTKAVRSAGSISFNVEMDLSRVS